MRDEFPTSVLQFGIKLSIQPPSGVRNNVLRTTRHRQRTRNIGDREIAGLYKRPGTAWRSFCSTERRKFGGIGWNIPYEWMASDLQTAVMQLQLLMDVEDVSQIPFKDMQSMVGTITYGGRITDKWDSPVCDSLLAPLLCENALTDNYDLGNGYTAPSNPLISLKETAEHARTSMSAIDSPSCLDCMKMEISRSTAKRLEPFFHPDMEGAVKEISNSSNIVDEMVKGIRNGCQRWWSSWNQ